MKLLLTGEAFDHLFSTFRVMAFHLEVEDTYQTPEESEPFRLFLDGRPDDFGWHQPWLKLIGEATRAGRAVTRVRVVSEPHVDYTRWGLSVAPLDIAAGEDVRWLPRQLTAGLGLPPDDFWLFDDDRVVFSLFEDNGRFAGGAQTTDPDIVERCCLLRDKVWALAIPHALYAAR
jgi:hypothetical protein